METRKEKVAPCGVCNRLIKGIESSPGNWSEYVGRGFVTKIHVNDDGELSHSMCVTELSVSDYGVQRSLF